MKKSIFGLAALAAIMLAGCSKNDVQSVNKAISGTISLAPSTSRAAITVLSTMENDAIGFKVYGTSATSFAAGNWYNDLGVTSGATVGTGAAIDGTNNHVWSSTITPPSTSNWNFADPVMWPTAAADYPMNFYAWYPAAPTGLVEGTQDASVPAVGFTFTVQDNTTLANMTTDPAVLAGQTDLVSTNAIANAKPASANLTMTFNHILSKVNFGIIADEGYTSHVLTVGVANVANVGTYDVVAQSPWSAVGAFGFTYIYFNGAPTTTPMDFAGVTGNAPSNPASTAEPFYAAGHSNNLMLMPQDPTTNMWAPPAPTVIDPSQAPTTQTYIYLLYRTETTSPTFATANPNFIGYASAVDHPNYVGSALEASGYTGPLFVKVGYPFDGSTTPLQFWDKGYGYVYNIELPGTSGGRLIDDMFYKDDGTPTDLPVITPDSPNDPYPDVPQPILNNDPYIHLIPVVTPWNDLTPPPPSTLQ